MRLIELALALGIVACWSSFTTGTFLSLKEEDLRRMGPPSSIGPKGPTPSQGPPPFNWTNGPPEPKVHKEGNPAVAPVPMERMMEGELRHFNQPFFVLPESTIDVSIPPKTLFIAFSLGPISITCHSGIRRGKIFVFGTDARTAWNCLTVTKYFGTKFFFAMLTKVRRPTSLIQCTIVTGTGTLTTTPAPTTTAAPTTTTAAPTTTPAPTTTAAPTTTTAAPTTTPAPTTTAAPTTTTAAPTTTPAPTTTTTPTTTTSSCSCGNKFTGNRIVNGVATNENEYPWQVSLVQKGDSTTRPFCGGSIICNEWIVTAAHCVYQSDTTNYEVIAGDHVYNIADTATQTNSMSQVIIHKDYNTNTYDNDIALVKLSSSLQTSDRIGPVCLPSVTANYYNPQDVVVTGWGTTSSGGNQAFTLQEVTVQTMLNSACNQDYDDTGMITNNMICAAALGKDSCQGDSGGPLVTTATTGAELVGIVSWGYGCADSRYPGVYTYVPKYVDWINANTGSCACSK